MAFLGYRATGQNNIPQAGGGILASNHQSYLDPVLVGIGLSRPVYFLAKQELFTANRLFGLLISLTNAVPLNRDATSTDIMRKAIGLLKEGKLIVVFPEGTRTSDGNVAPFKGGVTFLAQKSNTPIIPTNVWGAYQVWSRHSKLPNHLSPVKITYTKPVYPASDTSSESTLQQVRDQITGV